MGDGQCGDKAEIQHLLSLLVECGEGICSCFIEDGEITNPCLYHGWIAGRIGENELVPVTPPGEQHE
jgi:hypothetical protein